MYTQVSLCWAASEEEAIETAFRVWPNTVVPGQLSQDLPTPKHFEQATEIVTEEMVADSMPCGPDVGAIVEAVKRARRRRAPTTCTSTRSAPTRKASSTSGTASCATRSRAG